MYRIDKMQLGGDRLGSYNDTLELILIWNNLTWGNLIWSVPAY